MTAGAPSRAQCALLELFSEHVAIAVEHARMTAALQSSRDEMSHTAHHDPLIGLANRALLMDRGAESVALSRGFDVLVLGLDGFKAVNDTAGHRAGDEVLQALAARMLSCARAEDLVARVGGDEFAVIVPLPPTLRCSPRSAPAAARTARGMAARPSSTERGSGASSGTEGQDGKRPTRATSPRPDLQEDPMTAPTTRAVRIAAGSTAAALVMCTVSLVGTANAAPSPHLAAANQSVGSAPGSRIGGADRYETAAQVAQQLGRNGKDIFVIASGDPRSNGVDALSANYLAGIEAAAFKAPVPVLLTKPDELPDVTATTIRDLLGQRKDQSVPPAFYVVGGTTAVSEAVLNEVRAVAVASVPAGSVRSVERVGGPDRYDTAAAVGLQPGSPSVGKYVARFGQAPGSTAFLSNGLVPADALSAGPIAYRNHLPLLLTRPGTIPPATLNALDNDFIKNLIVLGGTTVVSEAVVDQLRARGLTVTRVAGADRYATNTALYGFVTRAAGGTAGDREGGLGYPSPTTALLANGVGFADALSAGPLAAEGLVAGDGRTAVAASSPLLLTSPAALSAATAQYLNGNRANITAVTGVGLETALPSSVLQATNTVAQGSAATQAAIQACRTWKVADGQSAAVGSGTRRDAATTALTAVPEYAPLATDMGFVSSLPETGNNQADVDKARVAVARIVATCQMLGVPGVKQA